MSIKVCRIQYRSDVPVKKVMLGQEDVSQMVMGSNPGACRGFFSNEISVKVLLCHLDEDLAEHFVSVSCILN